MLIGSCSSSNDLPWSVARQFHLRENRGRAAGLAHAKSGAAGTSMDGMDVSNHHPPGESLREKPASMNLAAMAKQCK